VKLRELMVWPHEWKQLQGLSTEFDTRNPLLTSCGRFIHADLTCRRSLGSSTALMFVCERFVGLLFINTVGVFPALGPFRRATYKGTTDLLQLLFIIKFAF